jgi:hypothetical protein
MDKFIPVPCFCKFCYPLSAKLIAMFFQKVLLLYLIF